MFTQAQVIDDMVAKFMSTGRARMTETGLVLDHSARKELSDYMLNLWNRGELQVLQNSNRSEKDKKAYISNAITSRFNKSTRYAPQGKATVSNGGIRVRSAQPQVPTKSKREELEDAIESCQCFISQLTLDPSLLEEGQDVDEVVLRLMSKLEGLELELKSLDYVKDPLLSQLGIKLKKAS